MYVQCDRCKTEYEFDDALVSERGTTVKCTSCAHQFKLRREKGTGDDRWIVDKRDGERRVFTSLKELQRAILNGEISKTDFLSRPGIEAKTIGSIAELEPFFNDPRHKRFDSTRPEEAAPPSSQTFEHKPISPDRVYTEPMLAVRPPERTSGEQRPSPIDPPPAVRQTPSYHPLPVQQPRMDDEDEMPVRKKGRLGGLVAAVIFLGCLGLIGFIAAKPYIEKQNAGAGTCAPTVAPGRVAELLSLGDVFWADGKMDSADEQYQKASALSENDPRVLHVLARSAVARADMDWLEERLMTELGASDEELRPVHTRLTEHVARAKQMVASMGTSDPASALLAIDSLRLAGDTEAARKKLGETKIGNVAEIAYSTAMLDLAEQRRDAGIVLLEDAKEKLQLASLSDSPFGRARAALVLALANAREVEKASSELEKLGLLKSPHPLVPMFRKLIALRSIKELDAGAADASRDASADAASANVAKVVQAAAGGGGGSDARRLLVGADALRRKGDLAGARQMYNAIIAENPSDSEALCGLGDVAQEQHDYTNARGYYKRALSQNSRLVNARVGLADIDWVTGNKPSASKLYKEIVDGYPESVFPYYVKTRAEAAAPEDEKSAP
ncbi:MAG: zinc-ribbon domain-containing protein [Polyangiaceae bacterium]|nr:zinc-ribbon domain-containing protein [Polyangiaceae bacterium]